MKQLQQKDLNFLKASQPVQQTEKKRGLKPLVILFPILLLVAGLGSWGFLQLQAFSLYGQISDAKQALQSLKADEKYAQLQTTEQSLAGLQTKVTNARLARAAMDSYPSLTASVFDTIGQCAGGSVRITAYSYIAADGLLHISGQAAGIADAALFESKLRYSGLFASLGYAGYTLDQTATDGFPYYFDVSGTLWGKEAGGNDQ